MIERKSYLDRIQGAFKLTPIVVLIGARQVGKTSIMKSLPVKPGEETLFLNGQDVEVAARFQLFSTIEQYLKIYLNPEMKGLLMIDEFQFIQGISTMLKLLTDKYEGLRILCSGSSSLDILQQIEESLAGRVRVIEVLSLSFSEYLQFKDERLWRLQQTVTDGRDDALVRPLQQALEEYLVYGGLPRVALTSEPEEKIAMLNDIYQTYLLHDVRTYIANEHFVGFNRLLRLLAVQIGNLVNVNELSRESGLPYGKCEEYIYLLQQMYIIKLIEPHFTNKRKVIGKMNKVYFCDIGLRNMIYNSFNDINFRTDNGALFENFVLLELWRNKPASGIIRFYRTQAGTEVDFVVDNSGHKIAVECKFKRLVNPISIPALSNLADEENMSGRYIANINMDETYKETRLMPGILADRIKV